MSDLHTAKMILISEAVAKLTLEALINSYMINGRPESKEAITAMRQALSNEALDKMAENARELGLDYDVKSDHRLMEQPAQQEPVAWISHSKNLLSWDKFYDDMTPLYTYPQAREWVGLTDDEIHDIYDEVARREPYNMAVTRRNIARAIEAKLKEKNT